MLDGMEGLAARVGEHGERLARHDAELASLKASTDRLESAISEVRGELRDTRTEIKAEMVRGFDRMEAAVGRITTEALSAFTPEAAREIGNTRAAEARARAWTVSLLGALVAALGVIAGLATHLL